MAIANPPPNEASQNDQTRGRQSGIWRGHEGKEDQHFRSLLQQRQALDNVDEEDEDYLAREQRRLERQKKKKEIQQKIREEEKAIAEAREKAHDAADAWRIKNNKWISDVDKKHEAAHGEHREKFKEHQALHVEHKETQAQLDARVVEVEQKTAEHHETLQKVEAHGNWLVPTVIGLAVVVSFGGLIWLGNKLFGKKKDTDEKEPDGNNGREHARAWRVAPEVSGEHPEWYPNDRDASDYTDYDSD